MSSTALVIPLAGTTSPSGRAAFAMLLFEDLALVPLLFLFASLGGAAEPGALLTVLWQGALVIAVMLVAGRIVLPPLFAQAARTKSPELFLAVSLLTVIVASLATGAVGLSPILGALVAGILIAETEYHSEVEHVMAPLRGLALGVFLITVGMSLNIEALVRDWPMLIAGAWAGVAGEDHRHRVLIVDERIATRCSGGNRIGDGQPVRDDPDPSRRGHGRGYDPASGGEFLAGGDGDGHDRDAVARDDRAGRGSARRPRRNGVCRGGRRSGENRHLRFRPGWPDGRRHARVARQNYLAVEHDIDSVLAAREGGYAVLFGDVARGAMVDKLDLGSADAVVLTMDDPVLTQRLAKRARAQFPDLPIIARARDTDHAARLYKAGVTDAVPEAMEASLQLSEAVLVDIGVAMGPVIASIHEKRSELRGEIMEAGELEAEPTLGRRRVRDAR